MTLFSTGTRVHVVGVGGAGMSGVARLLHEMGCRVSGSDRATSPVLDELSAAGIQIHLGHDAANGYDAEVVLWSPAVRVDNVELVAARSRGAQLVARASALAELAQHQPVVGLTGTHGKTTATSMTAHVLHAARRDDSRLLGAPVVGVGANGHYGTGSLLLEVDESYGSFALLHPFALGLLNVEADHLDHYGSLLELEAAFTQLLERTSGPVVVWADDPGARRVATRVERSVELVGRDVSATWRVSAEALHRRGATFRLTGPTQELEISLLVTGAHNVANAAVVAVLGLALGLAPMEVIDGLAAFRGAPRRFEFRGRWRGVDVYEDYAHLPGEIAATLESTRAAGYERITAVFQPHRVTRTVALAAAFPDSFASAHHVAVTDIYTAGEENPSGVTGAVIATGLDEVRDPGVSCYAPTFRDVLEVLERWHDVSDVVVLLGAGDIGALAARLVAAR